MKKILSVILSITILILSLAISSSAVEIGFLFGDADLDGEITASDARFVLRAAVGLEYYSVGHILLCDADEDEKLTAADARMILRFSVNLSKPNKENILIDSDEFKNYVNRPPDADIFSWDVPAAPEINAPSETFTFTVYGFGHGVGLSQYGALSLEDAGYTYTEILNHYYTGIEIRKLEEVPEKTVYPTIGEIETEKLLARIMYQEIYGVCQNGKYKESLKTMGVCIFTLLKYYDFNVQNRWDVGIATSKEYDTLPENLKILASEIVGQYLTVKGKDEPILAVYSGMAAGMTASSESVWGGKLSYLESVASPFDMKRDGFITQKTYTLEEMRKRIEKYDSEIILGDDPSLWLQILEHTSSMDSSRGYVTKIKVGNRVLSGYNQFLMGLMGNAFSSSCFTIHYTP